MSFLRQRAHSHSLLSNGCWKAGPSFLWNPTDRALILRLLLYRLCNSPCRFKLRRRRFLVGALEEITGNHIVESLSRVKQAKYRVCLNRAAARGVACGC